MTPGAVGMIFVDDMNACAYFTLPLDFITVIFNIKWIVKFNFFHFNYITLLALSCHQLRVFLHFD